VGVSESHLRNHKEGIKELTTYNNNYEKKNENVLEIIETGHEMHLICHIKVNYVIGRAQFKTISKVLAYV
jgi:hypothetical protein